MKDDKKKKEKHAEGRVLQAEGVAQITAQVIKQQDDELQEASSYYKVRTHGEKVEGKRGGKKKSHRICTMLTNLNTILLIIKNH